MYLFFKKRAGPIDPRPSEGEFSDVLAQESLDATPLIEALDFVRENLPLAENLGETGDERDYYHHLDRLATGVSQSFHSYCRAGCGSCCYYPIGLFTTSYTEWDVIRRHIETVWTPEQRRDLAARYRADYNGFWRIVLGYLQRSFVTLILTAPLLFQAKKACPFLVNQACTVYPARPYQCRTFGLFAVRAMGKVPKVYACNVQGENLLSQLAQAGPQIQLPVSNPIVRRIRKLTHGPKLSLPLWVGIWVTRWEQGRAVPGEGLTHE